MSSDNLSNLLDAFTETSVYVIEEETHRILYLNRRCREASHGKAAPGMKCHEVWPEVCANCPLKAMKDRPSVHFVSYDPLMKATVDITANRILWDGRIAAVAVTTAQHRLNFEEEQGLQKIEQIYAKSLVTVFDECIIANLTTDSYVNCQKDVRWTTIPQQGNFGAENSSYAQKLVHPDDLQRFHEAFSREAMLRLFAQGKTQIRRRLRRHSEDGTYHMVEFNAARIESLGEEECWCVLVFRDVHEEYLLEQQRNVEISQLATAAQAAYQMLIAVNLTQNTYHMLEYERYPVKKPGDAGSFQDLIDFELATVHPDYREEFLQKFSRQALIRAASNGERIVSMEIPHCGEDGVYHWSYTQVVPVKSPDTDDLIEITLSRNIDEERRARQMLEEALEKAEQASRAKSEFLSKMSHDIRTPMNAIIGMTELAQLHISEEEKLQDYLQKIKSSGAHLLELINEVLDVSKIESGAAVLEEEEFDLRTLVQDTVETVRFSLDARHQALSVQMADDLHTRVLGDARRLKQVLVNILDNASKYTGLKGRISLTLEELKKGEREVGTYRFAIEDNGIGMKEEFLGHIFEPFQRADDSRISTVTGTGLGMTIVQNILSIMGGDIEVESEYGKGSRFRVTVCLTKCKAREPAKASPLALEKEALPQMQILLVEDNELNSQIATEMLALLGAEVERAENGREAVEAVRSHPPFYYDIVFMDIQMPVLNGYDATRAIRELRMDGIDELPIVAMTADAFIEDAKQARLAGMNGHLSKPISIDRLRSVLCDCVTWKRQNHRMRLPGDDGERPLPSPSF